MYRPEQSNWEFWFWILHNVEICLFYATTLILCEINFGWFQKVKNCHLNNSDGSGLPEPENPTGFGPFLQTRSYPNPKISGFLKPETTRTRTFWILISPKLPEPEVQTRGYPTGLETLQIAPKSLEIAPNIFKIAPKTLKVVPKMALKYALIVALSHFCCVCALICFNQKWN